MDSPFFLNATNIQPSQFANIYYIEHKYELLMMKCKLLALVGTPGGYPIPLDLHCNLMSITGSTVRNRNCMGSNEDSLFFLNATKIQQSQFKSIHYIKHNYALLMMKCMLFFIKVNFLPLLVPPLPCLIIPYTQVMTNAEL